MEASHSKYLIITFKRLSFAQLFRFNGKWLKKLSNNSAYPEEGQNGVTISKIEILSPNTLVAIVKP